jgi:hypothetical protein
LNIAMQQDSIGIPRDYILENTLGIPKKTIDQWVADGKVPPFDGLGDVGSTVNLQDLVTQMQQAAPNISQIPAPTVPTVPLATPIVPAVP